MNAALGWALAAAAVAVGYMGYGWPGVLLALTVVVFWLLLQFSRALRVMRAAAQRPIGSIGSVGSAGRGTNSALMLQSKLQRGMRLAQVMRLTGSFGVAVAQPASSAPDTEVFAWTDAGGDTLQATLTAGQVATWELLRAKPTTAGATVDAPDVDASDAPGA